MPNKLLNLSWLSSGKSSTFSRKMVSGLELLSTRAKPCRTASEIKSTDKTIKLPSFWQHSMQVALCRSKAFQNCTTRGKVKKYHKGTVLQAVFIISFMIRRKGESIGFNISLPALSKRIPVVFATLLTATTIYSTTASASVPVTFTNNKL